MYHLPAAYLRLIKNLAVVMPMNNLIENRKNYRKATGSLWNYYNEEPAYPMKSSESFKYKTGIIGKQLLMVTQNKLNLL